MKESVKTVLELVDGLKTYLTCAVILVLLMLHWAGKLVLPPEFYAGLGVLALAFLRAGVGKAGPIAVLAFGALALTGCGTLDRTYNKQVTTESVPVVSVATNAVVSSNQIAEVVTRWRAVYETNAAGVVSSSEVVEPVATNYVTRLVTNFVPVLLTNYVSVPVTNLVAKPEAEATIQAAGAAVNAFLPGIGSIVALAMGGLYHGYRQVRNRKVNEALVQGVETARAILETTPQGQAADAAFVKWLMTHQKESGVFTTVSTLVDELTDNPAAKLTAQEIVERVQRSQVLPAKAA
jgi:hypothetical protein